MGLSESCGGGGAQVQVKSRNRTARSIRAIAGSKGLFLSLSLSHAFALDTPPRRPTENKVSAAPNLSGRSALLLNIICSCRDDNYHPA
jgi:hypothetical protein